MDVPVLFFSIIIFLIVAVFVLYLYYYLQARKWGRKQIFERISFSKNIRKIEVRLKQLTIIFLLIFVFFIFGLILFERSHVIYMNTTYFKDASFYVFPESIRAFNVLTYDNYIYTREHIPPERIKDYKLTPATALCINYTYSNAKRIDVYSKAFSFDDPLPLFSWNFYIVVPDNKTIDCHYHIIKSLQTALKSKGFNVVVTNISAVYDMNISKSYVLFLFDYIPIDYSLLYLLHNKECIVVLFSESINKGITKDGKIETIKTDETFGVRYGFISPKTIENYCYNGVFRFICSGLEPIDKHNYNVYGGQDGVYFIQKKGAKGGILFFNNNIKSGWGYSFPPKSCDYVDLFTSDIIKRIMSFSFYPSSFSSSVNMYDSDNNKTFRTIDTGCFYIPSSGTYQRLFFGLKSITGGVGEKTIDIYVEPKEISAVIFVPPVAYAGGMLKYIIYFEEDRILPNYTYYLFFEDPRTEKIVFNKTYSFRNPGKKEITNEVLLDANIESGEYVAKLKDSNNKLLAAVKFNIIKIRGAIINNEYIKISVVPSPIKNFNLMSNDPLFLQRVGDVYQHVQEHNNIYSLHCDRYNSQNIFCRSVYGRNIENTNFIISNSIIFGNYDVFAKKEIKTKEIPFFVVETKNNPPTGGGSVIFFVIFLIGVLFFLFAKNILRSKNVSFVGRGGTITLENTPMKKYDKKEEITMTNEQLDHCIKRTQETKNNYTTLSLNVLQNYITGSLLLETGRSAVNFSNENLINILKNRFYFSFLKDEYFGISFDSEVFKKNEKLINETNKERIYKSALILAYYINKKINNNKNVCIEMSKNETGDVVCFIKIENTYYFPFFFPTITESFCYSSYISNLICVYSSFVAERRKKEEIKNAKILLMEDDVHMFESNNGRVSFFFDFGYEIIK